MSFTVIRGTFHFEIGEPDGDSVRFRPDNAALVRALPRARSETIKADGTTQLRYEGIDSIEKEATPALVKKTLAKHKELAGVTGTTPKPRGYILSRTCEANGRPVAFAFKGTPTVADGKVLKLTAPLMRQSINTGMAASGFAYPLFYETLFAELRTVLVEAVRTARRAPPKGGQGCWPTDASTLGFKVSGRAAAATLPPIFPKLWRRLFKGFPGDPSNLRAFMRYLEAGNERVTTLSDGRFIAFDDVVELHKGGLRMRYAPEDLVFKPS